MISFRVHANDVTSRELFFDICAVKIEILKKNSFFERIFEQATKDNLGMGIGHQIID